ncbi:major facilitator superfamily domain-containing protein 10 isoform X1 [Otolemur garnettii]|uniref:major facilitator superfamily domain-containing protein 10 isoform X1 n=1 Tax=Otolemur garnettii TaxID=30611 RepID=UPI000C7EA095|nr:major facilitator superfamily domain-containing protein 10 isoform X1 [Otolemur garnettii]
MGWGGGGSCTPRPPIRQQPAPERRVVTVVFLGLLLDLLAFTLLLPLLPGLLESHGRAHDPLYSSWQRGVDWFATAIGMPVEKRYNSVLFGGLIGSAFSILQFLSAPITGAISDRLGRRPAMLLSLTGLAASYAVWATSRSFMAFLASRMIGGISKGNVSLSTAIIADLGSPPARSQGMCVTCCSSSASCQRRCPRISGHPPLLWDSEMPLICSAPWLYCASQLWHVAKTRPLETVRSWPSAATDRLGSLWPWPSLPLLLPRAQQPAPPGPGLLPLPLPVLGPGVLTELPGTPALPVQQPTAGENVFLHRPHHGHHPGCLHPADQPWQGSPGRETGRETSPDVGSSETGVVLRLPCPTPQAILLLVPAFLLVGWGHTLPMLGLGLLLYSFAAAVVVPCLSSVVAGYGSPGQKGTVMGTLRSLGALARAAGPMVAASVYWLAGAQVCFSVCSGLFLLPFFLLRTLGHLAGPAHMFKAE